MNLLEQLIINKVHPVPVGRVHKLGTKEGPPSDLPPRKCIRCEKTLDADAFYLVRGRLSPCCKACAKVRAAAYIRRQTKRKESNK